MIIIFYNASSLLSTAAAFQEHCQVCHHHKPPDDRCKWLRLIGFMVYALTNTRFKSELTSSGNLASELQREKGAFVWLELVCCPKPSAALSVIICSKNNSSFVGADSQSWFERSPACLGTLCFVLSIYGIVRHCSLDLSSTSMDLCFVVFGFVLFIPGFVRFCTLDLWSNSVDLCVAVLWICPLRQWIFVLLSWICALLPWICALLFFGFVLYINGFVFCFIICALLQCCFVSLCSHSMEICFWLFFFSLTFVLNEPVLLMLCASRPC